MPPTPPRPDRLDRSDLERPARHVARAVARARLRRVLEAAPLADQPCDDEALHDFRVSLRRLRAWLAAFRSELEDTVGRGSYRRLRRAADATGHARDLEVQVAWLSAPTLRLGPLAAGAAAYLADRLRADQTTAEREAIDVVAERLPRAARKLDRQLKRFEVRVAPDLRKQEPSVQAVLGGRLGEALGELRTALIVVTAPDQVTEAHRARLAVKRLRYLVETLAPAHRGADRAARTLARLQDALGRLHDRHVLLALVQEAPALPREGDPRPPTRRAYLALASALRRSARREFASVARMLRGRALAAALAAMDRLAEPPRPQAEPTDPPTTTEGSGVTVT